MNLSPVELRIALIDYFTLLILKCPLPADSQSMSQSANDEIADETASEGGFLEPLYFDALAKFMETPSPFERKSPELHCRDETP
jgi:hypothetical protein